MSKPYATQGFNESIGKGSIILSPLKPLLLNLFQSGVIQSKL